MTKYFFLLFIISTNMLFSQNFKNDSIKIFIDKSIELIQSNSIHTENIDLNDYHGNLKYKGKTYGWHNPSTFNTGGNMYPILLGLKEFIGDNLVFGGFKNAKGESTGSWQIKEDKLLIDDIRLERNTNLFTRSKRIFRYLF